MAVHLRRFNLSSWNPVVSTTIGRKIRIKFSPRKFAIGVYSSKNTTYYPTNYINFINRDWNQAQKDELIDNYQTTVCLSFIQSTFAKWHDISNDALFKQNLSEFLQCEQNKIAQAIASKILIHSRDIIQQKKKKKKKKKKRRSKMRKEKKEKKRLKKALKKFEILVFIGKSGFLFFRLKYNSDFPKTIEFFSLSSSNFSFHHPFI